MRSKYFDPFLIFILLITIVFVGYQLFGNFEKKKHLLGKQLAYIESKRATVKKRGNGFLSWEDVREKQTISDGDRVFTHDDSRVVIRFKDNSMLVLGENALVKIEQRKNQRLLLDVKKGAVSVELADAYSVKIGSVTIDLDRGGGTKMNVQATGNVSEVVLLDGRATINNENGRQNLGENSALKINERGDVLSVGKITSQLLTPVIGASVFVDTNEKVFFEWHTVTPKKLKNLLVARDRDFTENVSKLAITSKNKGKVGAFLEQGEYYWKIVDDKGNSLSVIESFYVEKIQAPIIEYPADKESFIIDERNNKKPGYDLQIAWKGKGVREYVIELLNAENKISTYRSKEQSLILNSLGPGKYQLRIGARFNSSGLKWSPKHSFLIGINPLPLTPTIISPTENTILHGRVLDIEVNKVEGISYRLKLIRDQKVLQEDDFNRNFFSLETEGYGTYCINLLAVDDLRRVSRFPAKRCFSLVPAAPRLKKKLSEFYLTMDFKGVKFEWNHPDDLDYQIQISRMRDFSQILLEKETQENEFFWETLSPGKYYWRVRAISNDVKGIYSKREAIEIKELPKLKAPILNPGEVFELSWECDQHHWWHLIIEEAHADSFETIIRWKEIGLAQKYQIEIYGDKKATNLIVMRAVDQNSFTWKDAAPGMYYWRIAYIDRFGRQSPFSKMVPMVVKHSKQSLRKFVRRKIDYDYRWDLDLSLAPVSLDYKLENYFDRITIEGGVLTSVAAKIIYRINHNIAIGTKGDLLRGSVLSGNFFLLDQKVLGEYRWHLASRFELKGLLGGRYFMINHSDPITNSQVTPVAGAEISYRTKWAHRLAVLAGSSFFQMGYNLIIPWSSRWYRQLGIDYCKESFEYDLNEVELSYFRFFIGGGLSF